MIANEPMSSEGVAPIEPLDLQFAYFDEQIKNVEAAINISQEAVQEAARAAEIYGLDDREKRLLGVELDYFCINPRDFEQSDKYWSAYWDGAKNLFLFGGKELINSGWHPRRGVTASAIPKAMEAPGVTAGNLRYVLYNDRHEVELAKYNLSARQYLQE